MMSDKDYLLSDLDFPEGKDTNRLEDLKKATYK